MTEQQKQSGPQVSDQADVREIVRARYAAAATRSAT